MDTFAVLLSQLMVLWIVVVGLAYMVGGPNSAGRVFLWPLRIGFRLLRWAIGGALVALGNAIRGNGGRNRAERRRH